MAEFFGGFLALMAFGTVTYWLLTVGWVVAMFWCVEKENGFMSGFWLVIYLLFLTFLAKVNVLVALRDAPIKCLIYVLAYFLIGFLWSFVKWWLMVNRRSAELREKRMNFLRDFMSGRERRNIREGMPDGLPSSASMITLDTPVPEDLMSQWRNSLSYKERIPLVSDHKSLIALWVIHWPFSMIWSVLNDFIKKMVNALVMRFRAVYHAITMRAFRGLDV